MIILLTCIVIYSSFAYGYGLATIIDCFSDMKNEKSKYYKKDRPIFFAGLVLILIWLLFPLAWPILGYLGWLDKEKIYGN